MKVLILAAGYGTRLYPVVRDTPKPLLDINGKPLISYLIEKVQDASDLNELILVTNDKFYGIFKLWRRQQNHYSFPVTIINDGTRSPEDRLGSIGDIDYVLKSHPVDDDLFVLGGDNLFDYSLNDFTSFAKEQAPSATIGLYDIGSVKDASKFGVVELDEGGGIRSFEEKPRSPKSSLIAMCTYFFPKESLGLVGQYIQETGRSDKAGDYIHWLVEKGPVFGFQFNGTWYDIGSLEALKEARENFKPQ